MAIFNPDVPDVQTQPNFRTESQSISQKEGDKSLGVALKGFGDVFEQGVKLYDETVKTFIKDEAVNKSSIIRDTRTAELEELSGRPSPSEAITGEGKGAPPGTERSIIAPDKPLPAELRTLPGRAAQLEGARANGKLSDSDYWARQSALATSLRSKYGPAYYDYVDHQIQKITGVDPANAYLKSLTADINATLTAKDANRAKDIALIDANLEFPGIAQLRGPYDAGLISPAKLRLEVGKFQVQKEQYAQNKRERDEDKGTRAQQKDIATDHATVMAAQEAHNLIHSMTVVSGETLGQQADKLRNGQLKGEEIIAFGNMVQGQKSLFIKQMVAKYNREGLTTKLGGQEEANKLINAAAIEFDTISKSIFDKDFGAAEYKKRLYETVITDKKHGLLTNEKLGPFVGLMEVLKGHSPEFASKVFDRLLLSNEKLLPAIKFYVDNDVLKMHTQPAAGNGGVNTAKAAIDGLEQKLGSDEFAKHSAEVFDRVFANIDGKGGLVDPTTPVAVKMNLAKAFFSEGNRGLVLKAQKESRDPATGKETKGQYSLYDRLTSEDVTNTMWELGKTDKNLWNMYKNWTTQTFGQELLRGTIRDLGDAQARPGIVMAWDSDYHQWKAAIDPNVHPRLQREARDYLPSLQLSIDKVNQALTAISGIAKKDGSDVEAFLWQTMKQYKFEINMDRPPQGIAEHMLESIRISKEQQEEGVKGLRKKYKPKKPTE